MSRQKSPALLLPQSEYKIVNWKNGGGKSSEIAIAPPGANFSTEPFDWRLSSSAMTENGPFSLFPDHERYLVVLEGEGGILRFEKSEIQLKPHEIHRFSGSKSANITLTSGPLVDLNLIFQHKQVKAWFEKVSLEGKPRSFHLDQGSTVFLFGLTGKIRVEVFPGEVKYSIAQGDTLRVESPKGEDEDSMILLDPEMKRCAIILIEIQNPNEK